MNKFRDVLAIFYPNRCYACGRVIKNGKLCTLCKKNLPYIDFRKRCYRCGLEKKHCQCNRYVYRFERVISVFEYDKAARDIVLAYKLSRRMYYSDFLADLMADSVRKEYKNFKFDAICFVPTSLKNKMKRGFDQSKLLCKKLSKRLNLPILSILGCRNFKPYQHKSSLRKRMSNVNGKYFFKRKINGGCILLVDDIKTTGATLDECAKQLLMAGAENVLCVTVLAAVYKEKY